jgi:hypothetical protein
MRIEEFKNAVVSYESLEGSYARGCGGGGAGHPSQPACSCEMKARGSVQAQGATGCAPTNDAHGNLMPQQLQRVCKSKSSPAPGFGPGTHQKAEIVSNSLSSEIVSACWWWCCGGGGGENCSHLLLRPSHTLHNACRSHLGLFGGSGILDGSDGIIKGTLVIVPCVLYA